MDPIKVLLVDDHTLFRSGVSSLLQSQEEYEVVGEAQSGEEALEKAKELMPDVVLMDVFMPGMGGFEATRRLKEILPYVKVVMLTIAEEEEALFEAIMSGAQGYLLKDIEPEDLFKMLKGVIRGEAPISRSTAAKILTELARRSEPGHKEDQSHERLTPREREILEYLSKGATNKEIGTYFYISENTVKNHLKNILEKLHLRNRVEAAAYFLRESRGQGSNS